MTFIQPGEKYKAQCRIGAGDATDFSRKPFWAKFGKICPNFAQNGKK